MSDYKYKLVNGELVELTADEIAWFEQVVRDALKREAQTPPAPPPDTGA